MSGDLKRLHSMARFCRGACTSAVTRQKNRGLRVRREGMRWLLAGSTLMFASLDRCGVLGYAAPTPRLPNVQRNLLAQQGSVRALCSLRGGNDSGFIAESDRSALRVIRINDSAKLPARSTAGSVGYDLCSAEDTFVKAGRSQLVGTALVVAVPEGFYGRVAPRSGLAVKHSIHVGAGVIDPDYRGELKVLLHNLGDQDLAISAGDRIAQLIIEACATPPVVEVSQLEETERGLGGFGSTGTA